MNNLKEPLKITVEFFNKKVSTEIDNSDLTIDEMHDLWQGILKCMGYDSTTISEYYE
tara:strand:+ start:261 stop:431 length:171 start_codon:yes stop_codon:yes gene_type:complete